MGELSLYFRPNFLGLLKSLNKLNWVIVFFSLINLSVCIYEDQIGKFDWRQSYVGRIKFAQFDTVSTAKKLIVATEENVLAALNLKTGQVVWRHVFESTSAGNIQLLHVTDKVVTVTGSNPYMVRGWDSYTGMLLWEWSLTVNNEEMSDLSEFWVQQGKLIHLLPVIGSHIEVTTYNLWSGRGASLKIPAQWVNDGCVLSAPFYTCVTGHIEDQRLISIDVTSDTAAVIVKPLSDFITPKTEVNLRSLDGNSIIPGFILDDVKIVLFKNNKFDILGVELGDPLASATIVDGTGGPMVLQTWSDVVQGFTLTAHSVSTGQELLEIQASDPKLQIPEPEISAALCTKTRENVCRLLLTASDDASHLVQQEGRVIWTREEALANVVAAEFVDLPVSDLDAAIESEFDQKEGSIWSAFSRRIQTQFQQLQTLIQSLQKADGSSDSEPTQLVRDYFNLHKIIVLVTDVGKIFGLDNLTGDILWKFFEPNLDTDGVAVFTRRSARHPPHDAYLSIVGKHEETGNAVIVSINPITGAPVGEGTLYLTVRPLQCALLHRADKHKLHALILLDSQENVKIFPESAAPLVENMFMYVADKNTAKVQGYALKYDGQRVVSSRTWSVSLGGGAGGRLAAAVGKPAREAARAAGAVLGDRSVLYKYSNHNLLLFVVDVPDPLHKDMVVATCVDAVSGAVVAAAAHRRARALPLAVHTDNSLAYVYYNDKHRRTEVATLELYEGKERWLPAGAAFSSLESERAPSVERQAYILAAAPTAAANTQTEKSLTDKHVLLALSSGAIVELPWQFLEPRRPISPSPTDREEGLIPYAPELPIPSDAIINYNKTVNRVKNIYTAPSGLESTCLVLATGLDLFYTRVAPSKTFDLLKDDFDYYLITIVLAALIIASYSTKYFASRKMLKMAWK